MATIETLLSPTTSEYGRLFENMAATAAATISDLESMFSWNDDVEVRVSAVQTGELNLTTTTTEEVVVDDNNCCNFGYEFRQIPADVLSEYNQTVTVDDNDDAPRGDNYSSWNRTRAQPTQTSSSKTSYETSETSCVTDKTVENCFGSLKTFVEGDIKIVAEQFSEFDITEMNQTSYSEMSQEQQIEIDDASKGEPVCDVTYYQFLFPSKKFKVHLYDNTDHITILI